jgi:hypothetical protein
MTLNCRLICKYRELARRVVEPGQLQARVKGRSLVSLGSERVGVAAFKTGTNSVPARLAPDRHEPPRLAQSDGRGKASNLHQTFKRTYGKIVRLETPHVAAPREKLKQLRAKLFSKLRLNHHAFPVGRMPMRCHGDSENKAFCLTTRFIDEPYSLSGRQMVETIGTRLA